MGFVLFKGSEIAKQTCEIRSKQMRNSVGHEKRNDARMMQKGINQVWQCGKSKCDKEAKQRFGVSQLARFRCPSSLDVVRLPVVSVAR